MQKTVQATSCGVISLVTHALRVRGAGRPIMISRRTSTLGTHRGLAAFVLVLLVWGGLAAGANAQDTKTVESAKKLVILSSPKEMTEAKAVMGTVAVVPTDDTPPTYRLVYTAPTADQDIKDIVSFKMNGETKNVNVTVTARTQPPTLESDDIYYDSFKALFMLFIVAVILESALAVVFNWRPFIEFFDSRGVKTVIAFVFSYIFVEVFNLDIMTRLMNLYSGSEYAESIAGKIVTALVLAGGSSGVNNLLMAFGFRSVLRPQQVEPRPDRNEAWISVRLQRAKATGPVYVLLEPEGGSATVIGAITGTSKRNRWFWYFLRDRGRFPTVAGYPVEPAKKYTIKLDGVDKDGNHIPSPVWGPYSLANRAIVDIDLKL
jgi:hypothetical protein